MKTLRLIVNELPTACIESYVRMFEAGRVQKHPQARFVNSEGECCIVGALAGARTSHDVVASPVYAGFNGSVLEELSRRFEAGRLTGQAFYEEAVLALVVRATAPVEAAESTSAAVEFAAAMAF
jgi:hypothetical protein